MERRKLTRSPAVWLKNKGRRAELPAGHPADLPPVSPSAVRHTSPKKFPYFLSVDDTFPKRETWRQQKGLVNRNKRVQFRPVFFVLFSNSSWRYIYVPSRVVICLARPWALLFVIYTPFSSFPFFSFSQKSSVCELEDEKFLHSRQSGFIPTVSLWSGRVCRDKIIQLRSPSAGSLPFNSFPLFQHYLYTRLALERYWPVPAAPSSVANQRHPAVSFHPISGRRKADTQRHYICVLWKKDC